MLFANVCAGFIRFLLWGILGMAFFGFSVFSSVSCVLGSASFASLPFAHKIWVS